MHLLLILLFLLLALMGPQIWARHVLARHRHPREDLGRTGAETARDLLDRFDLTEVEVAPTEGGAPYDPLKKAVRLSPENFGETSLSAVVVAAHEVGHALQDAGGHKLFETRVKMIKSGQWIQKAGVAILMATPLIGLITRSPRIGLVTLLAGLAAMGTTALIHLVTLPVEWDASFRRALPMLAAGRMVPDEDLPAARQILTACALTYLASSLASLLNLWRWLAILRR